jgi:hypothetical protein
MVDRGFDGARRVEGLGFVGLELFDVVHISNKLVTRYLMCRGLEAMLASIKCSQTIAMRASSSVVNSCSQTRRFSTVSKMLA